MKTPEKEKRNFWGRKKKAPASPPALEPSYSEQKEQMDAPPVTPSKRDEGWQKLFDLEHVYTNDGEAFGKWNIMTFERFKQMVILDDGKIHLKVSVSDLER